MPLLCGLASLEARPHKHSEESCGAEGLIHARPATTYLRASQAAQKLTLADLNRDLLASILSYMQFQSIADLRAAHAAWLAVCASAMVAQKTSDLCVLETVLQHCSHTGNLSQGSLAYLEDKADLPRHFAAVLRCSESIRENKLHVQVSCNVAQNNPEDTCAYSGQQLRARVIILQNLRVSWPSNGTRDSMGPMRWALWASLLVVNAEVQDMEAQEFYDCQEWL